MGSAEMFDIQPLFARTMKSVVVGCVSLEAPFVGMHKNGTEQIFVFAFKSFVDNGVASVFSAVAFGQRCHLSI